MARHQYRSGVKKEIVDAAARAAYVQAWASYEDEQGHSHGGGVDLMDIAPATPASAKKWAKKLVAVMEKMNGKKIEAMYEHAAAMEGHRKPPTPEDFGHYTAMQSMGHGVSWEDDHPEHGFLIPDTEFYCYSERGCDGYVSDKG